MNDNNDLPHTSVASFGEITSCARNNRDILNCNISVGPGFTVAIGCNPFFKAFIKERSPIRLDVMRVGIVKTGWCEPVIGFRNYHCGPGDLLFINWGAVLTDDDFAEDTTFVGISMTEGYMRDVFGGRLPDLFLSPGQCFSAPVRRRTGCLGAVYAYIEQAGPYGRRGPGYGQFIFPVFTSFHPFPV